MKQVSVAGAKTKNSFDRFDTLTYRYFTVFTKQSTKGPFFLNHELQRQCGSSQHDWIPSRIQCESLVFCLFVFCFFFLFFIFVLLSKTKVPQPVVVVSSHHHHHRGGFPAIVKLRLVFTKEKKMKKRTRFLFFFLFFVFCFFCLFVCERRELLLV